jgi:hypothetical protein
VSSLRISYSPRFDATPEAKRAALAAAYRFILDSHAQKKATEHILEPSDGDDGAIVGPQRGGESCRATTQ